MWDPESRYARTSYRGALPDPGTDLVSATVVCAQIPATAIPYLIGFCLLVRRSALDEVGGIDSTLPGGDDIDLSIRLRQAGYTLVCDRHSFVYHYGYRTGERVHGDRTVPGGWNSPQMIQATANALIAKHGETAFNEAWRNDPLGEYIAQEKRQCAQNSR